MLILFLLCTCWECWGLTTGMACPLVKSLHGRSSIFNSSPPSLSGLFFYSTTQSLDCVCACVCGHTPSLPNYLASLSPPPFRS